MEISRNLEITGFLVVGGLYRFSRENGAVLGCLGRDPVRCDWLVGLVQKILIDMWSPQSKALMVNVLLGDNQFGKCNVGGNGLFK